MAFVAWLQGNKILAFADTISALFLCSIFLYQKKTSNDNLAIYAGIVFCAFFYLYLFMYGGVGNSAFLWLYTFPLFVSFLLGSKKGLIVSITTLTVALIYFLITRLSDFHFALYSTDLMIRFFASVLVVILFSFVAEKNRESSYYLLEKANTDLENLTIDLTKNNRKLTHEISQRKKTEAKLVMEKQKAEEANKTKSEFLANMSHELRTPLNHIIGFTDLVVSEECGDLNEMQNEYLRDVLTSSNHLLSLINDILDLSKIEAGKIILEKKAIVLSSLFEQSIRMVQEKALQHRLQITTEIEKGVSTFKADERKIKQVLYNLLANAVKFTPDGGRITLSAATLKISEVNVIESVPNDWEERSSGWLKISLNDSGVGLKPENLESVFLTFEQVDSSVGRKFQGTGLGLSLTRQLVELHGGKIWAESPGLDQGSTFSLIIPFLR